MKKIYIIISGVLLLIFVSYCCFAKEDVLRPSRSYYPKDYPGLNNYAIIIGLEAGLNFNFFSQNIDWGNYYSSANLANPTAYNSYGTAFGVSPHFAFLADFPLGNKFNGEVRFDIDERNFKNSGSGLDWDISNIIFSEKKVNINWNITSLYLGIGAVLRYDITDNLFISGGLDYQHLSGYARETDNVSSGDAITPVNNFYFWRTASAGTSYTRVLDISNTNENRVGLELGLGYKIALSSKIWFVPQGRVQYFFTKFAPDDVIFNQRQLNGLQLLFALWYAVG